MPTFATTDSMIPDRLLKSPDLAPFAATIFVSAFLLFQLQPLMGKYLLPAFGGGPTIWTTCLVFFQIVLLAGYAYAYLSTRLLRGRAQVLLHGTLVLIALTQLSIAPDLVRLHQGTDRPTLDILLLLATSIGLPYFVLAASTPLLQSWFVRSRPHSSPYRLFALSNAGALVALLTYPLLFEPLLARTTQGTLWAVGFGLFTMLGAICARLCWGREHFNVPPPAATTAATGNDTETPSRPTMPVRLLWVVLPAFAVIVLLAITNQMTRDIIVVPFLWILPLSVYLLTFILPFASERGYPRGLFSLAYLPSLVLVWIILEGGEPMSIGVQIGGYTLSLLVCCMLCHGELARCKPDPSYLSEYYLLIAMGGAIGGCLVTFLAPVIFNDYFEFQTGLIGVGAVTLIALHVDSDSWLRRSRWLVPLCLLGLGSLSWMFIVQGREASEFVIERTRNFYGIHTLRHLDAGTPDERLQLLHGVSPHGTQYTLAARRDIATGYYTEKSGAGLTLLNFPRQQYRKIGLVGLGVGTLVSYARYGDAVTIYEIDPEIRRLADERFSYLRDSAAVIDIVMGDARQSMEQEADRNFDVLMLDAFTGDAIPVHLLTVEAFETYLRHLKHDGVIAILIDTWHLDLGPIIYRLALQLDLAAVRVTTAPGPMADWGADWMLLAREDRFLSVRPISGEAARRASNRLWTDDYTSLLPLVALNRK